MSKENNKYAEVENRRDEFEAVIGLEVHSQLLTKTKMFCSCQNIFGKEPNSAVCPVCLGLPGALPVINFESVRLAVKAALALNINVNNKSFFARKNYFYPDLPKGYQISQYLDPVSSNGYLDIETDGVKKRIRINRLHIEEDAGKLIHIGSASYVDLNRAGTPLVEIVSEPDISSAKEAVSYLKDLRDILVYLYISDGNMEEGSFRCDANVSVRRKGDTKLGTRAEVKNVNSFKFVEKAIDYEIERQLGVILGGGKVIQETRLYDSKEDTTRSMRGKEEAHDYRYFEEPDLPPLILENKFIEAVKITIGELPIAKRKRYAAEFALTPYDCDVLTQDKKIALYFEDLIELNKKAGGSSVDKQDSTGKIEAKKIANWVINELLFALKEKEKDGADMPEAVGFFNLILSVENGIINRNTGKLVLSEMLSTGKKPEDIIAEKNLSQVSDEKGLDDIIKQIFDENSKELADLISGKDKLFGFFVGEAMKKTKGKANPKKVNEILKKHIESYKIGEGGA